MIAMNLRMLRTSLAACVLSAVAVSGDLQTGPSAPPPPSPGGSQGPAGLDDVGPMAGNDGVGGIERTPFLRAPKEHDDGPMVDGKPNWGWESTQWMDLGKSIPGTAGEPRLEGEGDVKAGNTIVLRTENAKPAAPATLIVGFTQVDAPFKGGTLVPAADLMIGMATNDAGIIELPVTLPADFPAGMTLYLQTWIVDEAAYGGSAATNGLQMTSGK